MTVEDHYRAIYFEALDLLTACIKDRFNQLGYKTYGKVQALLLKAATSQPYEEELQFVSKLVILLVMPATKAECEHSFSAVHYIETYLRSTMSQQRLDHLMLLHVHKNYTDDLSLVDIANNFIADNEHRKHFFGPKFKLSEAH